MNNIYNEIYYNFKMLLSNTPSAVAVIMGAPEYTGLKGAVAFYEMPEGVMVVSQIKGLPANNEKCGGRFYGMHIHSGTECSGNQTDPFANAGQHYNPDDCLHPYHAGDLPPIIGDNSNAFQVTLTSRFNINEIIGKTLIIHSSPDDFTTQPSGNSGIKIACGVIEKWD